MNYRKMFEEMHPNFFENEHIKNIPDGEIYDEMVIFLDGYESAGLENPDKNITYGYYKGDFDAFLKKVEIVVPSWVPIFKPTDRIYCAFDGDNIASFCMIEDMGTYTEDGITYKIGGPGCVGTLPKYRKRGVGICMISKATDILKDLGYDISYIHYTGVPQFYENLPYKTVLRWNKYGIIKK